MRSKDFYMAAGWADRQMTPPEFVDEATRYLLELRQLHPLFRATMYLIGSSRKQSEPLAQDLSNLLSYVQRFGWDDKAPKNWNTGVLADGTMSLTGTARTGFMVSMNTTGAKVVAETMSLRVSCGGGDGVLGSLTMEFPSVGAPEFSDPTFVKRLVQVTVDCWQPESVKVVDAGFRQAVMTQTESRTEVIGWMNYFDRRDAEPALPVDVQREAFGPQGLLTLLQPEPPDENDSAAIERALRMYRALSPGQHLTYRKDRRQAGATSAG